MASLLDYLRQENAAYDANREALAQQLGSYQKSSDVLSALGQPVEQKKPGRSIMSRVGGFLGGVGTLLDTPGRLVRVALDELTGTPNKELQKVSGWDEVWKAVTGKVNASGADLTGLTSNKKDSFWKKLGKGVVNLGTEIALDPTTWLGNPNAVLRGVGQESIVTFATKGKLLEKVIDNSVKGAHVVEDLNRVAGAERVASAVTKATEAAKLAEASRAAEAAATGAEFVAKSADEIAAEATAAAAKEVAKEQLGDRLSTAYRRQGRSGLRKELEDITGSKVHAVNLFKEFADPVRGGIVLQTPWGSAIKNREGNVIRLAGGKGSSLGALGTAANNVRTSLGVATNLGTRFLHGADGTLLADVKKVDYLTMRGKDIPENLKPARFIDYVSSKTAKREARAELVAIQDKVIKSHKSQAEFVKGLSEADKEIYDQAWAAHFHNPALEVADDASPVYQAAVEAAASARRDMEDFNGIRVKNGIAPGDIDETNRYSPLIVKPEHVVEMIKDGTATSGGIYNMGKGRDAYVDLTGGIESGLSTPADGWIDPKTGVKYLNPLAINDALEKQAYDAAIAAGKTAEEAKALGQNARKFVENPSEIIHAYGGYVAKKSSMKRLMSVLESTGTIVRDIPQVKKVVDSFTRDSAMAAISGLEPRIVETLTTRAKSAEEELKKILSPETLAEQRQKVADAGAAVARDLEEKTNTVESLRRQVAEASSEVAANEPSIQGLRAELGTTRSAADAAVVQIDSNTRAAKNANNRLREARKALGAEADEKAVIERAMSMPDIPADEFDALNARALELSDSILVREQKVATEQAVKDQAAAKAAEMRAVRNEAESARAQQIVDRIDRHTEAVAKRDALIEQLNAARKERNTARASLRTVETDIASDQYTALQGIVDDYVSAAREVHSARTAVLPDGATPEAIAAQKARVKELEKAAKDKKKILDKSLTFAEKEQYGASVKEYAANVVAAASKLDAEELTVAMAMADSKRLTKIMDTIEGELGSSDAAIRAIDDLYTTFEELKSKLGDTALDGLKPVEERMLDDDALKRIKEGTYSTKTTTGAAGREARAAGMVSMNDMNSPVFKGFFGSQGIINAMDQVYKASQNTGEFDKFAAEYLDRFLANWKLGTTAARGPGFIVNNVIGATWNNFIGGVKAVQTARSAKVMERMSAGKVEAEIAKLTEKFGTTKTAGEIARLAEQSVAEQLNSTMIGDMGMGELWLKFRELGGAEGDTAEAIRRASAGGAALNAKNLEGKGWRGVYDAPATSAAQTGFRNVMDFMANNPLQRRLNSLTQGSESFVRFAAFLEGYERFGDVNSAMSMVHALHFDYADLSDAEKWVKRAVPFYTWSRNNIPLQVKAIVGQPGKFNSVMRAQGLVQELTEAEGSDSWTNSIMPGYLADKGGFVSRLKSGENMLGLTPNLPVNQLTDFINPDGSINKKGFVNLLGPQFKLPIELGTGINYDTGAKDTTNPLWKIAKNLSPQASTGRNIITAVDPLTGGRLPFAEEGKASQRAASLTGIAGLIGMNTSTVTPKSLAYGAADATDAMNAQINALAAARNIDPTWIRSQLDKGYEPWLVKMLLSSGLGRAERTGAAQTSEISDNTRARAIQALQGLGQ